MADEIERPWSVQDVFRSVLASTGSKSSVFGPVLTLNGILWVALGISSFHATIAPFHYVFLGTCIALMLASSGVYVYLLLKKPELLRSDPYQLAHMLSTQVGAQSVVAVAQKELVWSKESKTAPQEVAPPKGVKPRGKSTRVEKGKEEKP